ncbi:MAG: hypothetical protein ACRDIX_09790 [Actinomycetota bacterium]
MSARRYPATMTVFGALLPLLVGGCARPGGSATAVAPADLTVALGALCRAADFARGGDLFEARRTFQDQAHAFLHELAARGETRARPAVARLLEAKQRVEAALGAGGNGAPAEVGVLLESLEVATRELAGALDTPAPRCGRAGG